MKKSIKNLIIIFFLGISSGLPIALILSTLKALLVDKGFDMKTIGFFSLISLPYTLKFCFAPIIDSCKVPFLTKIFGQRRSWIILTQLTLGLFISLLGIAGIMANLETIAIFSLLVAFASASQDIVIDGYRIELVEKENQGFAASFYVYGYRIGMLISGALALALSDFVSWDAVYFIMAAIMFSMILILIFADETRKDWVAKKQGFFPWFKSFVIDPFVDFTHRKRWISIIGFIICYKLADAFAGNMTLPFLLEIGFSKLQIASIVKTFGLFATLLGVFIGGVLIKKIGMVKSLWIAISAQGISNLSFSYLSGIGNDTDLLYLVVFAENFSGGIGDAVFVAYLSNLCSINFSATQYAILASFATLARSVLVSGAGIFAQDFGWYYFFIISALLAIPSALLLALISRDKN